MPSSKIKVLHIITRLDRGGSATNTIETLARLDKQKFETFLISGKTHDPDGSIEETLKSKGIQYVFIAELVRNINPVKDLAAFFKLFRMIKSQGYDIVHTHTSKAGILGRWAARLAGVKRIIHTPHGHIFYGYFGKFLTGIFIWLERLTAKISERIITLTDRGAQEHVEFKIAPKEKFITVYSGIDLKPYAHRREPDIGSFRKHWQIPADVCVFGYVGRLTPIKGVGHLIDATKLLIKKSSKVHLMIIGDGEERQSLINQCQAQGIERHVTFCGFQSDVISFLEQMDVFVLPSLNEGMGRVVLEAMACGRPVIATRVGGVPEIVDDGKTGILVDPKDVGALKDAMSILESDRKMRQQLGSQGQIKASDRFSLEKMVQDIENIYLSSEHL